MKAHVKATGEIIEVKEEFDISNVMVEVFYSNVEDPYEVYEKEELDFDVKEKSFPEDGTRDYWTRLEHQYAGMAMQGLCANTKFMQDHEGDFQCNEDMIAVYAKDIAHALVEKIKEERK